MKASFGLIGLLLVLAIVGLLAKKQLSSVNNIQVPVVPGAPAGVGAAVDPQATVQQQSQQIQQQFKAAAEAAVQQPRPMPDEK